MTKDEIIKLARQAGLQPYYDEQEPAIEAFANLVAAAEYERGQMDALNSACVVLRQVHDSFLLSSKPGRLDATQVRTKP